MGVQPLRLVAVALLALAACSQQPASTPPAEAPAAAPAAPAASAAPDAAPATAPAASAAPSTQPTPPAEESKLEKAAPLPPAGQLPAGKWVAGTNYRPVVPAQPTEAAPGKVEVVEVFWYGCPHCYALEPFLTAWLKNKAPYIEFRRVPVTWQPVHQSHARLFYALDVLGKETALHSQVFDEMHVRKNYMYAQGDDAETYSAQASFAKAHGISEADFGNAYKSFTVQTDLSKADDLVHRYHIDGVPTIIVNGKYITDVNMACADRPNDRNCNGHERLISLINDLAASEKGR
ncbi:MAG TPA: thiol:disulfide interchange protein DsbA/DsbL [Steroidobacteraceae bacterium]|nr:thiol:disulfide interchange protein DsbA/DsbL [Steroidobacteraceae bacterium]